MMYRYAIALVLCTLAFSAFAAQDGSPIEDGQVFAMVPAHDIARGAVIEDGDLVQKAMPAQRINNSIVRDASEANGKEARRALRAGEMLRSTDFKRPTLVAKGSTVTMVYEAPGVKLTAVGRALAEGGEGDSVTVLNPVSYRQVVAEVIGPGTVRVGASRPVISSRALAPVRALPVRSAPRPRPIP
jgi:flagellar basal body P-ring formation protein FlgA